MDEKFGILTFGIWFFSVICSMVALHIDRKNMKFQRNIYRNGVNLGVTELKELYERFSNLHTGEIKFVEYGTGEFENMVQVGGSQGIYYYYISDGYVYIKYPPEYLFLNRGLLAIFRHFRFQSQLKQIVEANLIMDRLVESDGKNMPLGDDSGIMTGTTLLRLSIVMMILGTILFFMAVGAFDNLSFFENKEKKYVEYMKGKKFVYNPDYTFEEVFEYCLDDPEWEYKKTKRGEFVVTISEYRDQKTSFEAEFAFNVSDESEISERGTVTLDYIYDGKDELHGEQAVEFIHDMIDWYANYLSSKSVEGEDGNENNSFDGGNETQVDNDHVSVFDSDVYRENNEGLDGIEYEKDDAVYDDEDEDNEDKDEDNEDEEPLLAKRITHKPKDLGKYVKLEVYSAYASSSLEQEHNDNSVMMMFDGKNKTSWQEGVEGYGVGETIDVEFKKDYTVKYIGFKLGNWRSDKWYQENARPKQMTLELGGEEVKLSFKNGRKIQWIRLDDAAETDELRFVINDYYKGTVYEDTCIAEIYFYGE